MIRVSPQHQISLAEGLLSMLERPPDKDYVLRRISQKTVNGQPLIQGELVISGNETLREYPLAREFPVHFRKTYYPICFHQDPGHEFANHLAASQIIDVPPPIGSTRTTFRSCYLPGIPLDRLSPFGVEPEERNIELARDVDPVAAIGLWSLLERVFDQVVVLHQNGFVHGDLFLHNVVVSKSPIGPHLIDFEQAVRRDEDAVPDAEWEEKVAADLREILREALFVQCALGRQEGALAEAVGRALANLVGDPRRFERAVERQTSGA